ncbi:MAG: TonB-dependent receptor [Gemmatimonadota bacterium]|jgi:vitamin B12 transporter
MRIFMIAVAVLVLPRAAGAQEDVFSLDGVVVTVSPTPRARDAVASHVSVLDGDQLRARGIASVGEALSDVGGLDVVRGGSFGAVTSLFLRGGESDHTLVLVDGVQVNRSGGTVDLSSLTLDNVERIEVVRGPASALYGSDAMAGVIQIVTRMGRGAPRITASVEAAAFSEPREEPVDGVRWTAGVTGGSDRFGYSASLGHEETDGILAFNNRFSRTAFKGRGGFVPDDRTRIDLTVGVTDREYHRPTDGGGNVVDHNAFDFGDETLAHLRVTRTVAPRVELQALLGVSEIDAGTDDAPDDASDMDSFVSLDHFRRASAEARANVTLRNAILTVGGELEQERQRSFSESASSYGTSYGRSENERLNKAVFVHATSEPGLLALSAGVRLEDNERFGRDATWEAGASLSVPGLPRTRLRARVGTAIKEPTFFENFATGFVAGNPDLDPERSRSWEAGVEQELSTWGSMQATYFDQHLQDLIQYTAAPPVAGDPNYFNVAGAASRGVELEAEARWRGLEAGATYTWLHTEVTDSGFDDGPGAELVDGARLLRRPTHTASFHGAAAVAARGRIHTSMSYIGDRADRSFDPVTFASSREELPDYWLWTVGARWAVVDASASRPDVAVSLRVENLLDESYQEAWGFRAPGRQLYLGVSMGIGGTR